MKDDTDFNVTLAEARQHSAEIIEQFGDGTTYNRHRIVDEARFYLAQSAEAMLEAGKRLVLIKEHEPHGDFVEIVEKQLGMATRTAQHMMQAAIKYLSPALKSKAPTLAHLGKSKLFELLTEDDDELAALGEGGTVAGLTLDEVDRMSVRELRKALRDARDENTDKDAVLAAKNQKIDELDMKLHKQPIIDKTPPDELEQATSELRREAAMVSFNAEAYLRHNVYQALQAVLDQGVEHGLDTAPWVHGQLNQLREAYDYLREQLGFVSWDQATVYEAPEGTKPIGGRIDTHFEALAAQQAADEEVPIWPGSEAVIDDDAEPQS